MFARLWRDERAIEGLPIRLVIALVVGVASLSVMMNTLSGMEGLTVSEVDVAPDPEVVQPTETDLTLTVLDPDGKGVADATVVVKSGTATLDGVLTAKTNEEGVANVTIDPTLRRNQREGTIELDVQPPAIGGYTDRRSNTKLLVVRG